MDHQVEVANPRRRICAYAENSTGHSRQPGQRETIFKTEINKDIKWPFQKTGSLAGRGNEKETEVLFGKVVKKDRLGLECDLICWCRISKHRHLFTLFFKISRKIF